MISPSLSAVENNITFPARHRFVSEYGREYVVIDDLETMPPFFLGLTSAGEQWFFISSEGVPVAGRQSPDQSLFPYQTVDKILDSWDSVGSWTALMVNGIRWEPFARHQAILPQIKRRLFKSTLGDELIFEEHHHGFGLVFRFRWQLSEKFGFVRKASLENINGEELDVRLVDGLDNLLPPGVDSQLYQQYSCLADSYKITELLKDGAMAIHRLNSGIVDAPIPMESLSATTVWVDGFDPEMTLLTRQDAEEFLRGSRPTQRQEQRGRRGTVLLARKIQLMPEDQLDWVMVADIGQTQRDTQELLSQLDAPQALRAKVDADIDHGSQRLHNFVASSDGFQETADRDAALYHYHNTLCNVLRGGVPEKVYSINTNSWKHFLKSQRPDLLENEAEWFARLPEEMSRQELFQKAEERNNKDLIRLLEEYLPLVMSRRHGDPSRPWNRFNIRLTDDKGEAIHHYEGNWRDIFQNWEALALSYPEYLTSFITKFLNASTADGYNPYRITSQGIDWEAPDEDDPWVSIGYWGDHQVIYLLKFLELQAQINPEDMQKRLTQADYVFAHVPYHLKGWEETLADPRDTIVFDHALDKKLQERRTLIGADGLLRHDENGDLVRVTFLEKILIPALVKLSNLIPGGGMWMNTQKPEWNDANNALAGYGMSVVTTSYLHRYLSFLISFLEEHGADQFTLTMGLADLLHDLGTAFQLPSWADSNTITPQERYSMAKSLGCAGEKYREALSEGGLSSQKEISKEELLSHLHTAHLAVRGILKSNRRSDQLWHSYNILSIDNKNRGLKIKHLPLMLEGQVAILSSGMLTPEEALRILESLPGSDLRTERHQTYLLYPDRQVSGFLERNTVSPEDILSIPLFSKMLENNDERLILKDDSCGYRFSSEMVNEYALIASLDSFAREKPYADLVAPSRETISALYEKTFNHASFTGRSGSMFSYEGLGCVYWHMVSKLMLAAQECALSAHEAGTNETTLSRFGRAYYEVQSGLGFRKTPANYGAFPAEPYSHSPGHAGAKQPGLTGQVKEGILCRFGELGVSFQDGSLSFKPSLLRKAEFGDEGKQEIRFTVCRVPVTYSLEETINTSQAVVTMTNGEEQTFEKAVLSKEITKFIREDALSVSEIKVSLPKGTLIF